MDRKKIPLNSSIGRAAIAGAIGPASATAFLDFVRDNTLVVTPDDVLTSYGPDSETRKRFKKYLPKGGDGRLDKVTELADGLAKRIFMDITKKPQAIATQLSV